MADNSFIPASDLDFQSYKNQLKEFLKRQNRFTDANFEGSNLNVLLDLLSYNTTNEAFFVNMVGSEAYLDSADLRANIVSRAKELNYTPRSRVSATCTVTIEIVPNDTPSSIVIPKGTKFRTTNVAGTTLTFVTTEAHTLQRNLNGEYIKSGITIREGELS